MQVAALVNPVAPVGRLESRRVHRPRVALLAVRAIARDAHDDHHGGADKKGQFGGGDAGETTLLRALLSLVSATLLKLVSINIEVDAQDKPDELP